VECVTRVIMNSNKVMILKEVVVALILAPYVGCHSWGHGFAHVNEESAGLVS
jgi:hypothetical protein